MATDHVARLARLLIERWINRGISRFGRLRKKRSAEPRSILGGGWKERFGPEMIPPEITVPPLKILGGAQVFDVEYC